MSDIATVAEFAYAIRLTPEKAADHELLLDLAEGLVIEELGVLTTYPVSAKAVVLSAAARAYFNPSGISQESVGTVSRSFPSAQMGVYLTPGEIDRIHGRTSQPTYSFPGTWPYPDPVERPTDTVSG